MNLNLAKRLREKEVLKVETKVKAVVTASGIGGDPVRVNKELVLVEANKDYCIGFNNREPDKLYKVRYRDIHAIDGMTLERIARAYDLFDDGKARPIGLKPGRKPKNG